MNRNLSGNTSGIIDQMLSGSVAGNIQFNNEGGSNVTITPTLESGTKIADFTIDDTSGSIYAPTPTTYEAGDNITIENGVISATDTTYTAGDGISIDNGVISATGEGQTKPIYFDFTKSVIDRNYFICPVSTTKYANNGLTFNTENDYFSVNKFLLAKNMTYEIEVGSMNLTDTSRHNTLFRYQNVGTTQNAGLIYRYQTLKWAVWDSTNTWQDSDISDKDYFNNSTIKIKILDDGKWEIYKDDVLVFAPHIAPIFEGTDSFGLGSPGACLTNITINSFKIYPTT